ncbi:hypothetical protein KQH49_13920 [Mycetohabitans sp. B5]|uniref:LysE type translocator n=1 Tax=Mycetohabitans endofungorum TaxID=417203 RepID=A0A2P5KD87_9BURK|nr:MULTISPECIES: hypothetical protein [Mycetohabitans]MCG1055965.1 hypothetical protein [Mycetohabitans sp. B5]PPB84669.1 hypothetical protein B0O95_10267 [Mycetohabitans endofungorum]
MLGITHFPLFIAAVFLLNLTPGPDTAYIVGRSFVAWIAGTTTQRLSGRARVRQWLECGVGSAFIGLGIKLVMTTR